MNEIRFSLLSEGSSDAALVPIIKWVFREHAVNNTLITGTRVDEGRLPRSNRRSISARLRLAIDVYPCEFLLLHRDADGPDWQARIAEIASWCAEAELGGVQAVPIIPVQETEAWLLLDEGAIRRAAAFPNGTMDLNLPSPRKLELLANPKERLLETLRLASGLSGRRLRKFNIDAARIAIGERIEDYKVLRKLDAFVRFESEVKKSLQSFNTKQK